VKRGRPKRRKRGRVVASLNRLRGELERVRRVYVDHWYPVVDEPPVVLNAPFWRRRRLLEWFPAGTVRAVRGIEFASDRYRAYIRWDPAMDAAVAIFPGSLVPEPHEAELEYAQIAPLRGSEILRLARAAVRSQGPRKYRGTDAGRPAVD
jgi:hypothetical protein